MKMAQREKILLIAAGACLALLALDKLVLDPLSSAWTARSKEIARLRSELFDGRNLVRREAAIRGHWNQMRTNTLPDNPSVAQEQVLKAVVNWAQESGTSLNGMTPQWKTDTEGYKTLSCRVDASGSLWVLSRFLYDLEQGPMALKLESVELNSRDNTGQQLTLGLQLSGLALSASAK